MTTSLQTDFAPVQAHYDLCDEFFALFLDPSMTYSCAKFDTPDTTLADAQRAKIDLALDKCGLRPGLRLLDIGCGWGATALRAHELYGVHVIGLTLSKNQYLHDQTLSAGRTSLAFRLEGWETFKEQVDRIVTIGAFEHFGRAKYQAFFARCRSLLPGDGVLVLQTITLGKPSRAFTFLRFAHFLSTKIFPGGDVPTPERVIEAVRAGGFEAVHVESLRQHYVRTLECWANNLVNNQSRALPLVGEEAYRRYVQYLTSSAHFFQSGECNVYQFKLRPV